MSRKKLFEIDKDSIVKATKGGYLYCTTTPPHPYGEVRGDRNKKYVYLHRAVKEQQLGRYLKPLEQVNHKDDNKEHNYPSNLVLTTRGPHQKEHSKETRFWKKSPRNKPGRKAVLRVLAKLSKNIEAEELYQDFTEDPAYKKMSDLYPDYNSWQADEATVYLMGVFKKKHPDLDKEIINRVKDKVKAGIT